MRWMREQREKKKAGLDRNGLLANVQIFRRDVDGMDSRTAPSE
jgi:hypothetical protein